MAAPSGGGGGGGGRRARAKPVRFRVSEKTQERAEQTKAALERMYEEKAKVRDEIAERCVALMCPSPIHNTGIFYICLLATASCVHLHCRHAALEEAMADASLTPQQKKELLTQHKQDQRAALRTRRKRMSPSDFESLAVIGRGAFGEVRSLWRGWVTGSQPCIALTSTTLLLRCCAGAAGEGEGNWQSVGHEDHDQRSHGDEEPGKGPACLLREGESIHHTNHCKHTGGACTC